MVVFVPAGETVSCVVQTLCLLFVQAAFLGFLSHVFHTVGWRAAFISAKYLGLKPISLFVLFLLRPFTGFQAVLSCVFSRSSICMITSTLSRKHCHRIALQGSRYLRLSKLSTSERISVPCFCIRFPNGKVLLHIFFLDTNKSLMTSDLIMCTSHMHAHM